MTDQTFSFPAPSAVLRGIECVMEYNGYIFNDRRTPERVRVLSMDSPEADVDDVRSKNPGRGGETPYKSTQGGLPLTMNVKVEAGNDEQLRQMAQDFRGAFTDINAEHPLQLHWWDINEPWTKTTDINAYTSVGLGVPTTTGGGFITTPLNGVARTRYLVRSLERRSASYRDFEISQRVKIHNHNRIIGVGKLNPDLSDPLGMYASIYSPGGGADIVVQIRTVGGGADNTVLDRFTPYTTAYMWLTFRMLDNVATIELRPDAASGPQEVWTPPMVSGSYQLLAGDYNLFGSPVSGYPAMIVNTTSVDSVQGRLKVTGINPGDYQIRCKKVAPLPRPDAWGALWQREVQVLLRSSVGYWESAFQEIKEIYPTSFVGGLRVYDRTYDLQYNSYVDASGAVASPATVSVTNRGILPGRPLYRLYGRLVNPSFSNRKTGNRLTINGTIPTGGFIDIDLSKASPVVVDQDGNSMRSLVDDTSSFPLTVKGDNPYDIIANDFDGAGRLVVFSRSAA